MGEQYEGPVQLWSPDEATAQLIAQLEASDDPLDRAYAEAYNHACWIREFSVPGMTGMTLTAVGDLHPLVELEFRHDIEIDVAEFTLGDCVELGYPGDGDTRAERVLDGVRQVVAART